MDVHAATLSDLHRTNNVAEGWNNRLRNLVGHHHPTVWTLIEALQADAAEASATVLTAAPFRWKSAADQIKCSRAATAHQQRLRCLCDDYYAGRRDLVGFMQAIGHCIRLTESL